jgi:secreted Zn-dependent insulinase-like peptidase
VTNSTRSCGRALLHMRVQVGLSSEDLRLRVLADLAEQVLSEALYDSLRTKQQLGYTVSSGARLTHGVTGFCVVVVSAAFDAATVEQRVEAFMHTFQHETLQVGTSWHSAGAGCQARVGCFKQMPVQVQMQHM